MSRERESNSCNRTPIKAVIIILQMSAISAAIEVIVVVVVVDSNFRFLINRIAISASDFNSL